MSIGNDSNDGSRRANATREWGALQSMNGAVDADVVARRLLPTSEWFATGSILSKAVGKEQQAAAVERSRVWLSLRRSVKTPRFGDSGPLLNSPKIWKRTVLLWCHLCQKETVIYKRMIKISLIVTEKSHFFVKDKTALKEIIWWP